MNKTPRRIYVRNSKKMNISYIAESQGIRVSDFVRLAIREYCDRHGISKAMPSSITSGLIT